jgi:hypothetical protein
MHISRNGNEVTGAMVIGEDSVGFEGSITADNCLRFSKGNMRLPERYAGGRKVRYRMDDMMFDVWNDRIKGWLNLYSLWQEEPERPMSFELLREGSDGSHNQQKSFMTITPNPFETQFNATFELQNESDVMVNIYNIYGMMAWQQQLGHFTKGVQTVTISPNVKPGKYVVTIKADRQMFHSIIIKGGAIQ